MVRLFRRYVNLQTLSIGIILLVVIYVVRAICLFFLMEKYFPQLFLAPRGLITILLFLAIPEELTQKYDFNGILLFIILASCLIMTWSLIKYKEANSRPLEPIDGSDEDHEEHEDNLSEEEAEENIEL